MSAHAEAIAGAVRALHGDPDRRRHLGAAARAFVEARYGRDRLARDYLAVLEPLAKGGARA